MILCYPLFYLKIINNMIILPPIIISVVVSKFFTESIRFETFEVISIPTFVEGGVTVFVVVVRGSSIPGSAVWVDGICAYWKGKLSLCFKRNGNYL